MKTMTTSQFKTHFADAVKAISAGETVMVTFGKKKEVVGYFIKDLQQKPERVLGILQGKVTATFMPDFKMTDEELLSL